MALLRLLTGCPHQFVHSNALAALAGVAQGAGLSFAGHYASVMACLRYQSIAGDARVLGVLGVFRDQGCLKVLTGATEEEFQRYRSSVWLCLKLGTYGTTYTMR